MKVFVLSKYQKEFGWYVVRIHHSMDSAKKHAEQIIPRVWEKINGDFPGETMFTLHQQFKIEEMDTAA